MVLRLVRLEIEVEHDERPLGAVAFGAAVFVWRHDKTFHRQFRCCRNRQTDFFAANDFDRLEIGTGVQWHEEQGDKGPQASTVRIIDKPG